MEKIGSVLLIEDDEVTNFYNEHVLRKAEISDVIYKALNGKEAIDILSGASAPADYVLPSLILMDLHMPIMDGWEFLDLYHSLPKEKQVGDVIVMLTNPLSGEQKAKAEAFPLITHYLPKPLDVTQLEAYLKSK